MIGGSGQWEACSVSVWSVKTDHVTWESCDRNKVIKHVQVIDDLW